MGRRRERGAELGDQASQRISRSPANTVVEGSVYQITASWGPFAVHEPVQVVAVVDDPDRCGFAYGTSWGHPVSGEEAFIVHRSPDGAVILTLRSLTRPAPTGSGDLPSPSCWWRSASTGAGTSAR